MPFLSRVQSFLSFEFPEFFTSYFKTYHTLVAINKMYLFLWPIKIKKSTRVWLNMNSLSTEFGVSSCGSTGRILNTASRANFLHFHPKKIAKVLWSM